MTVNPVRNGNMSKCVGAAAGAILLLAAACEWRTEPLPGRLAAAHPGAPSGKAAPASETPLSANAKLLTDTARFLAGLPVEEAGPLAPLAGTAAWGGYAKTTGTLWERFKAGEAKIRAWAARELAEVFDPARPVFYPFGGPDIAFADIFLTGAEEYVLVGLEDVGSVPRPADLPAQDLAPELALFAKSLDDLLGLSFFRTNDMKEDLAHPFLDGVVPVIMVLLARLDKVILSVETGDLDPDGAFAPADEGAAGKRLAATIHFRDAGGARIKTLRYFSANLYDGELLKNGPLLAFLDRELTPCFTFLKSASYLMHHPFFGEIRRRILGMSYAILQDDSAVPYRFFDRADWDVSLYWWYDGPIKLFQDDFETELYDAYRSTPGIKPLNFRFGYAPVSDLLLAVKRIR